MDDPDYPDARYSAERPPNWMEISPSGRTWTSREAGPIPRRPVSRPRRLRRRLGISQEHRDAEWQEWEERWDNWPCWTHCPDCGYETPMEAGGSAGPGWAGMCPQCGRSVWLPLSSPEVRNNLHPSEEE